MTVFEQQNETRGDWPQWFMLEPYASIRDRHSHGDVIVWPLKAVCDYVEATNDVGFLDEPVAWRREDNLERTERGAIRSRRTSTSSSPPCATRFIPGTQLIRYGEGDWNNSLQPADPHLRDWMVSSWTVALLYQQLGRYAEVLPPGRPRRAAAELSALAGSMREDFNRHLIRDGTVAGYAVFDPGGGEPELMLHPRDTRTGLQLLAPADDTQHHRRPVHRGSGAASSRLIREHLLFPDGVRLMDRPVTYHGGRQEVFQRAESAAFFGREIGLLYVHAHLRYGEALAKLRRGGRALGGAADGEPGRRSPRPSPTPRRASATPTSAAATRPSTTAIRRAPNGLAPGAGRLPSTAGGASTRADLGSTPACSVCHALGLRRRFGERIVDPVLPRILGAHHCRAGRGRS